MGVFSLGFLQLLTCRKYKRNERFRLSYLFESSQSLLGWKGKRIFRFTYISHHITMSGYFPPCSLHLVHSCWKRLLIVVPSKGFVFIFHRPRPRSVIAVGAVTTTNKWVQHRKNFHSYVYCMTQTTHIYPLSRRLGKALSSPRRATSWFWLILLPLWWARPWPFISTFYTRSNFQAKFSMSDFL
jgi:hypothetical protein